MATVGSALVRSMLRRGLPQAMIIVVLGTVVGLVLNQSRLDPLPIELPEALLLTESGAEAIFLGKARQLFDEADYVFVDVRSEEQFVDRHIEDAFCLPLEKFIPLYPELQAWTAGQPILVYGSAREIVLADDLARRLLEAGEGKVVILADGIEGWAERGFPLVSGSDGLLEDPFEASDEDEFDGFDDESTYADDSEEEDQP